MFSAAWMQLDPGELVAAWCSSGALQGEVPGGKCLSGLFFLSTAIPQNDHNASVMFGETPPILSGGLTASEIPHHSSQKWRRMPVLVALFWDRYLPNMLPESSHFVTLQNTASLSCIDVGWV